MIEQDGMCVDKEPSPRSGPLQITPEDDLAA